jgi:hypothetical protein
MGLCAGTYVCSFLPEVAGTYRLAVSIDGKLIKGSPFDIKVRTDETVAGHCRALGAGLQGGGVGDVHAFTVQAVDGKGNARTIGGDGFRVTANGTPGKVHLPSPTQLTF